MQICHWSLRVLIGAVASVLLLSLFGVTPAQETSATRAADEAANKVAGVFPLLQGLVVEVDGSRVMIDLGRRLGAYEGMELEVYREGDAVRHPVTGHVLGKRDLRLGVIRVEQVKEEFSEAVVVSLEKEAKLSWGDSVRVSGDRITLALPLIDPGDVRAANVQSITKNLAIALTKTGRFLVVEEPMIRASLASEQQSGARHPADPLVLKVLAEKLRAQVLILGKLSQADKRAFLGLQVLSVRTGATLGLASVELKGF